MNGKVQYTQKPDYIGDSVYVWYDGYHIWLETRNGLPTDPSNQIALEPNVFRNLVEYVERLKEKPTTEEQR
jgi:hypothetical protein